MLGCSVATLIRSRAPAVDAAGLVAIKPSSSAWPSATRSTINELLIVFPLIGRRSSIPGYSVARPTTRYTRSARPR